MVDASVAIKLFINEPLSDQAAALFSILEAAPAALSAVRDDDHRRRAAAVRLLRAAGRHGGASRHHAKEPAGGDDRRLRSAIGLSDFEAVMTACGPDAVSRP